MAGTMDGMALITRSRTSVGARTVNYLDDAVVAAYFAAREHVAYFRSLKAAQERRDFHERLIPVLRAFVDRAVPSAFDVLDGIIGRTIDVDPAPSTRDLLALVRERQPTGLELLDVEADVDFNELRSAYRRAALRYHPDRGGSDEQMAAINEAYEILHAGLSAQVAGVPELQEGEPEADAGPRCALDYVWCTLFELFQVAVDDWALDDASKLLQELQSDRFRESRYTRSEDRWIELTKPAADLSKRWVAAGNRKAAEAALVVARTGVARARRNGLTFDIYLDPAEKVFAGTSKPGFGLNHLRQVENAHRYGAIDEKKYAAARAKLAADQQARAADRARRSEVMNRVRFVEQLPIDPKVEVAAPASSLVPSPDYFQVRAEDLSPEQLAEYHRAFSPSSTLDLVAKYAYVRLSSLIRSAIHHPDEVEPAVLAAEVRNIVDLVPRSGGFGEPIAKVLEMFAKLDRAGRREYATVLQQLLTPEPVEGALITVSGPDGTGLEPFFLEDAVRIGLGQGSPRASRPNLQALEENRRRTEDLERFNEDTKRRLRAGDLDAIADAVEFFVDDIDCLLVYIEVGGWLKMLVDGRRFGECARLIVRINELLDDLIEERRTHRYYGRQTLASYRSAKERFNEKLGKLVFPGKMRIEVVGDDVLDLVETVRRFGGTASPGLLERAADGCAAADRIAEARTYYIAAIEAAMAAGKPTATVSRLKKKTAALR